MKTKAFTLKNPHQKCNDGDDNQKLNNSCFTSSDSNSRAFTLAEFVSTYMRMGTSIVSADWYLSFIFSIFIKHRLLLVNAI